MQTAREGSVTIVRSPQVRDRAFAWTPPRAPVPRVEGPDGSWGLPLTRPWTSRAPRAMEPLFCRGRYAGTDLLRGRREPPPLSAIAMALAVAPQEGFGAAHARRPSRAKPRQHTLPEEDGTRTYTAEKSQKSAPRGSRSLDNGGPHKGSARDWEQTPTWPPMPPRLLRRLHDYATPTPVAFVPFVRAIISSTVMTCAVDMARMTRLARWTSAALMEP
jgi:hypothetical protein